MCVCVTEHGGKAAHGSAVISVLADNGRVRTDRSKTHWRQEARSEEAVEQQCNKGLNLESSKSTEVPLTTPIPAMSPHH